MLINFSNHPTTQWTKQQKQMAENIYGEIYDMQFPQIDPQWDIAEIEELAREYFNKIIEKTSDSNNKNIAVHLMGETVFCFCLANMLKKQNIKCIASTTEREANIENGVKKSVFKFVKFREYYKL